MKRVILLAIGVVMALLCAMPTASAVENGGVGGVPANPNPNNTRTQSIFVYQLKAGEQVSDAVKILNNTDKQQTLTVLAVDSVLSGGGAFACRQAGEPKKDVGSWITLDTTSVTLEPNSNQIVPFTLTVPDSKSTDVGEHDGCITIQAASQTAKPSDKNGIVFSFRSALRVAVTIPGKIVKKLSLTKVSVKPTAKHKYLVTPMAQNDGNVSLDADLRIKILSLFGTQVVAVKEGSSPVLPHTKASWNYEVKRPFWGGFYKARVTASYNSDLSAELGVDKNAKLVTKTQDSKLFFAAPAPLAGLIEVVVVAAIAAALYWFWRQRTHAKHVRRHWKERTARKRDTLHSLATEYQVSWKEIAKVNHLKPPYDVAGKKLKLPSEKG